MATDLGYVYGWYANKTNPFVDASDVHPNRVKKDEEIGVSHHHATAAVSS